MKRTPYWFRPARFLEFFAAYYPVSVEGWIVTIASVLAFAVVFADVDAHSHSGSDTLIGVAPWMITIFVVFDVTCRWKGEYPNWWSSPERSKDTGRAGKGKVRT
ncbi:MAG: hypothetical protein RL681_188 [Candidatus Parcubacteria bacterium]|jgi:hypothetical protein